MPGRQLSRKIPLAISAPFYLIAPHTLIISQALKAPFAHGHRKSPITFTHNINQLCRGHDVRLNFIASLRPLLVRVRIPYETGFAPGCADEAESKAVRCCCQISRELKQWLYEQCTHGMLGPVSTNVPLMFLTTVSLAG